MKAALDLSSLYSFFDLRIEGCYTEEDLSCIDECIYMLRKCSNIPYPILDDISKRAYESFSSNDYDGGFIDD